MKRCLLLILLGTTLNSFTAEPGPTHTLKTRWAKDVTPDKVWPEYPRPQLTRENWINLNGRWDYAILPKTAPKPKAWEGKILVPFAAESQLSGVQRYVGAENRLWYRRTFPTPELAENGRLLLHFGAVDWEAEVWVNGQPIGVHKGGYDPFSFDITSALKAEGPNELVVAVWDPTDTWSQPRGKQVTRPHGIWYTPVSGIWQTVWLEPVPALYMESVTIKSERTRGTCEVRVTLGGEGPPVTILGDIRQGELSLGTYIGENGLLRFRIPQPREWSPDQPVLYELTLRIAPRDQAPPRAPVGSILDRVETYFAFRDITSRIDDYGVQRLCLNGKPLFQYGPLDQGWWPDGLYTAPTDEALRHDIEVTKALGFNMIRKHVKVEPARWYAHCDRIGMLVWQDMPSAFAIQDRARAHVKPHDEKDWQRPFDSAMQFETELREMLVDFRHFPSIVAWVPINEGWGQYDTTRLSEWVKAIDPFRLVNAVSGWTDRGVGDMRDVHQYPGPGMEPIAQNPDRAVVLGEFGGLGLALPEHVLIQEKNWGYKSYDSREELARQYHRLVRNLRPMIDRGLAAAVYTQTTDVETEVNGLMTYDRAVTKFDVSETRTLHQALYRPAGHAIWHLPDSEVRPQSWRFTKTTPGTGWKKTAFDDAGWKTGQAPFRSDAGGFFDQGTVWTGNTLWLRREFEVATPTSGLSMKIFCDTGGEVFLNGIFIHRLKPMRVRRHYDDINLSEHAGVLKAGKNLIAVHAFKNKKGHRGIDLGLYGYEAAELDLDASGPSDR